tara:strand:+ start:104 stop:511 length:408 start_codon:yes stop_codon:yes gene_type:complete
METANPNPLILCFDYGLKYIGVATGRTAYTITQQPTLKHPLSNQELNSILSKHRADRIAVGYPLNMDGSRQTMTQHVDDFIKRLKKLQSQPIDLVDERLTTYEAKRRLNQHQGDWNKVNATAAQVILEQWFYEHC